MGPGLRRYLVQRLAFAALMLFGVWLAPLVILRLAPAAPAAAGEIAGRVEELTTRPGVTLRFLLLTPSEPAGSLILFAGGHGNLDLGPDGRIGWGRGNFLVRTRQRFAEAGFVVAVLDAASDFKAAEGIGGYRFSAAHAEDVRAAIAYLRGIKGPVWLVGTSAGTLSAANAASRLVEEGPDGVVLTASVTRGGRRDPRSLQDIALEKIRVPVLLAHNRDDQCWATPFDDVEKLKRWLKGSPKVEVLAFAGGDRPRSDPCEAMSYHGFLGLEGQVVRAITDWIRAARAGEKS
jgi:dienelactone hydrolase